MVKKRGSKGKYEYWISEDGLLKIEGWARDGLVDKQNCIKYGYYPEDVCIKIVLI